MNLAEVLNAREERWARKQSLIEETGGNVISLTLRMPIDVRTSAEGRAFFGFVTDKTEHVFEKAGLPTQGKTVFDSADGPYCLWTSAINAIEIKKTCVAVEREEAFGEYIDLDVMAMNGEEVSRRAVGSGNRKCIVCGFENARACILEKRHTTEETENAVRRKIMRMYEK